MDNKSGIILILGIVLVYVLAVGYGTVARPTFLPTNFTLGGLSTTPTTNIIEKTVVQEKIIRIDLTALFLPYTIINPNSEANCLAGGGEPSWNSNNIGCTSFDAGTINCFSAEMLSVAQQCRALSPLMVEWGCDNQNVFCRYKI